MPALAAADTDGRVLLTDPGALRALAHPARVLAVDELYTGGDRTASELAQVTGLTPSAMSYHLRALERWGVVERAPSRADGREHPWRAAGTSLSFRADARDDATVAVEDIAAGAILDVVRAELRRFSLAERDASQTWRDVAGIHRTTLWLDEDEAVALTRELREVLRRFEADRTALQHPPRARRVTCVVALAPAPPGADDSEALPQPRKEEPRTQTAKGSRRNAPSRR